MISIIISHYKINHLENIKSNIKKTIGNIPYEIIAIDNPGIMGICNAYNLGAEKAQFPYLLFCHEDILFHTDNWGPILIKHLDNPLVGTIGVAGSSYVPKAPSGWFLQNHGYNFINISQHENGQIVNYTTKTQKPIKVYALDGVFLAITKKKYYTIKFNERLKGFHGYDLDFTLRSTLLYENYVINDLLIEHFSYGNADEKWLNNIIKVRSKINGKFQKEIDNSLEEKTFTEFFEAFFKYNKVNFFNLLKTVKYHPSPINRRVIKFYLNHLRYSKKYNNMYKQPQK